MKKPKSAKKILVVIIIVVFVIVTAIAGYYFYGLYKINQLSKMTFEEMINYTTENKPDAVISVAIIDKGEITYNAYGENGIKLDMEERYYEIGSISKTFATSLLAKAISENRLNLDDSIEMYLHLSHKDDYPQIKNLVTHTSGYKEYYFEKVMISNYFNKENPFKGITEEMVIKRLEKTDLGNAEYSFKYSNFGMATLGLILQNIYDEEFKSLMNDYILYDLKLSDTAISDKYDHENKYWKWSDDDAYIPAGAIISNITDMAGYLQIQMNEEPDYISMTHNALSQVAYTNSIHEKMGIHVDAVAMGWMIDNKNNIIWHNGGTTNYNCYIGFDKNKQTGIVILSNLSPDYRIPATVMGIELLTSLVDE